MKRTKQTAGSKRQWPVVGRGRWEPWRDEKPQRTSAHRWPAQYRGLVWIIVRPLATNVGKIHDLDLWWGTWHCPLTIQITQKDGLAITTGKDEDEVAVTCNLDCSPLAFTLSGIGE